MVLYFTKTIGGNITAVITTRPVAVYSLYLMVLDINTPRPSPVYLRCYMIADLSPCVI